MKINIVTDTTATLPLEYIKKENIEIFPIYYTFEDEEYKEPDPEKYDIFYEKLVNSKNFPTTSQPPLGEIIKTFEKSLSDNPDAVIVLPMSEKLSGTYNSCKLAKQMIADERIHIVNTKTTTLNLKKMVEYLVELRKLDITIEEILYRLDMHRNHQEVYFIPETLEYLQRGGRLSKVSAAVGDVLSIKPIVSVLEDGSLGQIEKVRGYNKAILKMKSFLDEEVKYISIAYVYNKEKSMKLCEELREIYPEINVALEEVSPSIGCHIGPGTVGILFGKYFNLD